MLLKAKKVTGHLNIVGVDILSQVKSRQIVLSETHERGGTAEFFCLSTVILRY